MQRRRSSLDVHLRQAGIYVLASKRIAALMDAGAISRLDYGVAECREASGEVLASLPKGVIGNYHSIMTPNCHSRVSSRRGNIQRSNYENPGNYSATTPPDRQEYSLVFPRLRHVH